MDMAREMLKLLLSQRLKLMLNQVTEAMDMVVMVMAEAMEVMVDTEAMEVMDMARERLKPMLSQDTEAMDMVVMVMAEAMEVMVDTEEYHPPFTIQHCTKSGGCQPESGGQIVIDSNW